jgi:acyl-CoA thioesterase I
MRKLIAALITVWLVFTAGVARAQIVAFGASDTAGCCGEGVGPGGAYPARLETMLRARGYDVHVENAGINGDTTASMLSRLDSAVPPGTRLVILDEYGGYFNDRKRNPGPVFANVAAIKARLAARGIKVIVKPYPHEIPMQPGWRVGSGRQHDGVHSSFEGHQRIATYLLPKVVAALGGARIARQ